MKDQQYEMNEARLLAKQLDYVRLASLNDRKAARAEMLEAMRDDPATVAERVSWLINGSYGYGACRKAKTILESRGNKPAALVQLVGALEWSCPERFTAEAWNQLSDAAKAALNQAVMSEIESTESAIAD
jgi:hypothetical protein